MLKKQRQKQHRNDTETDVNRQSNFRIWVEEVVQGQGPECKDLSENLQNHEYKNQMCVSSIFNHSGPTWGGREDRKILRNSLVSYPGTHNEKTAEFPCQTR